MSLSAPDIRRCNHSIDFTLSHTLFPSHCVEPSRHFNRRCWKFSHLRRVFNWCFWWSSLLFFKFLQHWALWLDKLGLAFRLVLFALFLAVSMFKIFAADAASSCSTVLLLRSLVFFFALLCVFRKIELLWKSHFSNIQNEVWHYWVKAGERLCCYTFPSAGFCPRLGCRAHYSSTWAKVPLWQVVIYVWALLHATRFDSARSFNSKRRLFFFFFFLYIDASGSRLSVSSHWKKKRKNKVRDVDVVVCVSVPFYLQATRPVSSSPQSSRRESRLCGGSASNARLAAAVKIKERTRWVDELIWPTGSGCNALFFARVPDRDADRRVWVILVSLDAISSGGWLLFKCLSWGLTVGGDAQPATICALSKTEKQQSCSKQPRSVVTRHTASL